MFGSVTKEENDFYENKISEKQLRENLNKKISDKIYLDDLIINIKNEKQSATKELSEGNIKIGFLATKIPKNDAIQRLQNLKYTLADSELIVELWGADK